MNRTTTASNSNGEAKTTFAQQQDNVAYTYEGSYSMYSSSSSVPTSVNQPLPGQPPLPPMPPPPGALPPLPHIFGPVPSQVASIQTWAHPPPPPWQWITPQAASVQPQTQRDMNTNAFQRDVAARNNYVRRDRFNNNRNNVYAQRNNFHRNKNNRRQQRFEQTQGQFDPAAYYGQALTTGLSLDWQRTNIAAAQNEALMNHMAASLPGHQLTTATPRVATGRSEEETADQSVKIVSEVALKKTKQRKPMSQNYPSRPWNREDAESALQIENEYNTIRAPSLIIKFPDPDLNKDIVREFHSGIKNIHFQSPSGPRYCFIQMAENVNIDDAIKELEKIPFGVGNLKVERKSLRDEDNPMPEEIDPYTLYVGNLPESVNVNEVKSKFPTAARVDIGYAQKMRNTRYAFIRYTNVEDSIAAYKKAHDLMWDTRSTIVRFRRHRGNTCLPGEPKNNCKKVTEEPVNKQVKKERVNSGNGQKDKTDSRTSSSANTEDIGDIAEMRTQPSSTSSTPVATVEATQQQPKQPWRSQVVILPSESEVPAMVIEKDSGPKTVKIVDIKDEPDDFDDMEMSYMHMEEDIDDIENDNVEEDDDDEEDMIDANNIARRNDKGIKDSGPPNVEPVNKQVKKERVNCGNGRKDRTNSRTLSSANTGEIGDIAETSTQPSSTSSTRVATVEATQQQPKQPWRSQRVIVPTASEVPATAIEKDPRPETVKAVDIKEEPEDYDDMEMSYMRMEDDIDDDDDDDDDDEDDEDEDDIAREEEDIDDIENENVEEDDDDEEDMIDANNMPRRNDKGIKDSEPPDALDQMFGEVENMIACHIEL